MAFLSSFDPSLNSSTNCFKSRLSFCFILSQFFLNFFYTVVSRRSHFPVALLHACFPCYSKIHSLWQLPKIRYGKKPQMQRCLSTICTHICNLSKSKSYLSSNADDHFGALQLYMHDESLDLKESSGLIATYPPVIADEIKFWEHPYTISIIVLLAGTFAEVSKAFMYGLDSQAMMCAVL